METKEIVYNGKKINIITSLPNEYYEKTLPNETFEEIKELIIENNKQTCLGEQQ